MPIVKVEQLFILFWWGRLFGSVAQEISPVIIQVRQPGKNYNSRKKNVFSKVIVISKITFKI